MKNRIGDFIEQFTVSHLDESSRIVSIYQFGVIKRHSTSQIRSFLEQPSIFDDSITERKVEGQHVKTENDPDEPEFDGENVRLNNGQHSYGEKSISDDSDNVTENCDQEITKA